MTITSSPLPTAGQRHTLNCFATTEDYVVNVPVLKWLFIDSNDVIGTVQINGTISANRSLIIDPLRTSHGGHFTCRARIDVLQAGISDRSDDVSEVVIVQSKQSGLITNIVCIASNMFTQFYLPLCWYLSTLLPTMGQSSL